MNILIRLTEIPFLCSHQTRFRACRSHVLIVSGLSFAWRVPRAGGSCRLPYSHPNMSRTPICLLFFLVAAHTSSSCRAVFLATLNSLFSTNFIWIFYFLFEVECPWQLDRSLIPYLSATLAIQIGCEPAHHSPFRFSRFRHVNLCSNEFVCLSYYFQEHSTFRDATSCMGSKLNSPPERTEARSEVVNDTCQSTSTTVDCIDQLVWCQKHRPLTVVVPKIGASIGLSIVAARVSANLLYLILVNGKRMIVALMAVVWFPIAISTANHIRLGSNPIPFLSFLSHSLFSHYIITVDLNGSKWLLHQTENVKANLTVNLA